MQYYICIASVKLLHAEGRPTYPGESMKTLAEEAAFIVETTGFSEVETIFQDLRRDAGCTGEPVSSFVEKVI